jgi:hypothetical protein
MHFASDARIPHQVPVEEALSMAKSAVQTTVTLKHMAAGLAGTHEMAKKQSETILGDFVGLVVKIQAPARRLKSRRVRKSPFGPPRNSRKRSNKGDGGRQVGYGLLLRNYGIAGAPRLAVEKDACKPNLH